MNERIKELAIKAGINKDAFQFSGTPIKHIVDEPSLEKFAELIVAECNSKLDNIGVIDRDSRTIAMKVISEHFGVEE